MSRGSGASATPTGLSPTVEPASGLDGSATSIPSAVHGAAVLLQNADGTASCALGMGLTAVAALGAAMDQVPAGATYCGAARSHIDVDAFMEDIVRRSHAAWEAWVDAQGIEARSDETAQQAQPEGVAPTPSDPLTHGE